MISVTVTPTNRTPRGTWTRWQSYTRHFDTMADAREFLRDEYAHCKKRIPCYQDTRSRGTIQTGYIYCFKIREDGKTYYQQDWVSFAETDSRAIDVNAA